MSSAKSEERRAKIAVFVSGGGTNLQALIDAQKAAIIKSGKISLVVSSNPEAFAISRAQSADIAHVTVDLAELTTQTDFEERLCALMDLWQIDLIVLAGFMRILSESFTSRFEGRIINVHPSLIPAFCGKGFYGLRVHKAALSYGVKLTGATVHYVNQTPDGGEIISQKAVEVLDSDTPETLQKRVMEQAEWLLLPQACESVCKQILKGR